MLAVDMYCLLHGPLYTALVQRWLVTKYTYFYFVTVVNLIYATCNTYLSSYAFLLTFMLQFLHSFFYYLALNFVKLGYICIIFMSAIVTTTWRNSRCITVNE